MGTTLSKFHVSGKPPSKLEVGLGFGLGGNEPRTLGKMRLSIALTFGRGYLKNQTGHYISRTVMVKDNEVEEAMTLLTRLVANEGILKRWRGTRKYEKPYIARNRVNLERPKSIYDEDMRNKINFIMRKNRTDPYPGTN